MLQVNKSVAKLAQLPLAMLRGLGWLLGLAMYYLRSTVRRIVEVNVFLTKPGMPLDKQLALTRSTLGHIGMAMMESFWVWLKTDRAVARAMPDTEINRQNVSKIREIMAQGPAVFLSVHGANQEMLACWLADIGQDLDTKVAILYTPLRPRTRFKVWLENLRPWRTRLNLIAVDQGVLAVRHLYKHINSGGSVILLPDLNPNMGAGKWKFLYKHVIRAPQLPEKIVQLPAIQTVVWCWVERTPRGFQLQVRDSSLNTLAKQKRSTRLPNEPDLIDHLLAEMEQVIDQLGPQYSFWAYKRFRFDANKQAVFNSYARDTARTLLAQRRQ
ncbi:MAG: lysophospholipid acyltransferase family protein [Gammaproteobacteria bacterium]